MRSTASVSLSPGRPSRAKAPSTQQAAPFLGFLPLREFFSLDVRSLALFRLGLALMVLLDWLDRLPDMGAHYSDEGIVVREAITALQPWAIYPFSLFMFNGSPWFGAALTGLGCLFAVLLLVGWRTPFVTLVNWFLILGVQARNPAVMQGGDHLIRMLLFWSIFLPLGACFSIDAARAGSSGSKPAPGVFSLASAAYIVQLCLVYWYAAAWKWAPEWRTDGTAIALALQADCFTTRFSLFMLGYPEVLRWLTFGTLWLETLGPAVLFFPFAPALQRLIVLSLFLCFHAGLALSLELATFPWVCCVAWLPLLPSSFWNRIQAQLRQDEVAGLTLYHDADRRRAGTLVAGLRTFLLLGDARLAAAQEAPAVLPRLRQEGGWGVVDVRGGEHYGLDALVLLVRLSPVFASLAGMFHFRPVRRLAEVLLRWLARPERKRPAADPSPAPAPAWTPPGGLIANTIVLFCLIYVVLWNIRFYGLGTAEWYSTPTEKAEDACRWLLPSQATQLGRAIGIDQGWGLFAPRPGKNVGWHLIIGTQEDGKEIDLYRDGAPVDRAKPPLLAATYPNGRWRKLFMNLPARNDFPYLLEGCAAYYFQRWNAAHEGPERLRAVEIVYMKEETRPPGEARPPVEEISLYRYPPRPEVK